MVDTCCGSLLDIVELCGSVQLELGAHKTISLKVVVMRKDQSLPSIQLADVHGYQVFIRSSKI